MAHLALYRRLRPNNFSEIVGQEHIVRILKNQLRAGTVSHAYLFCGTRGTGKTSMAKILAKALNCDNLGDYGPCGLCDSCLAAAQNRNLNIIEIDAASNNGVDNVREIREEVKYPPSNGGVKIYIIDEVHMLSTGAFNALLKTLEEPPERVVFILATTDVQRIPATILSRCVRLDFKRITADEMSAALKEFTDAENISADMEALRYICSLSDGAMRDALSLLDQCISYYPGEVISSEKVMVITGAVDSKVFFQLFDALISFNSAYCLDVIAEIADYGRDISRFISDFIQHLRNLMVISSTNGATTFGLDMPESVREKYLAQGKPVDSARLMGFIHEFSALASSLRYSFNERIMLECLCIKLCNPGSNESEDLRALITRLEKLEAMQPAESDAKVGEKLKKADANTKVSVDGYEEKREKMEDTSASKNISKDIKDIISDWDELKKTFEAPMSIFLESTKAGALGDGLSIIFSDDSWISHVNERKEIISQALLKKYGRDYALSFVSAAGQGLSVGEKTFGKNGCSARPGIKSLTEKLGDIDIEYE